MKTFGQHLSEQPEKSKLDKLTHVTKLSKKRLKQLARPYPVFQHLNLEDWMGYYPPSNSSEKTKKEIQYITSLGEFRTQWEDDMIMSDLKIMKAFQVYLDKYGLEVNTIDRIKEYKEQSEPIILVLKRHYNRPRPVALAKELGLPLDTFPLKTANTPSYPSGHATQGRLVALLLADEVPLEHRKNILDIGERIGHGRQIAGAHYPTDSEFGKRLADELYRMAKSSMEPDLTLEELLNDEAISNLDEGWRDFVKGLKKKLTRTWSRVKRFIGRAFNKLKRMAPGQETIITIPGIKQESMDMGDKKKITLNEGSLQAIKGNYNEALVLQYLYEWKGNGVSISKKWADQKPKIDAIVKDWDTQLRTKISNWRPAKKIIEQGSVDMTKYLVGTTLANDAIIIGAYLDNLSYQGGAEFKADIQVAVMKEGKEMLTGYSLKLYSGKSVGLANTSPKRLAGHLVGPEAEKKVASAIANDQELQELIAKAKHADKQKKLAAKEGDKAAVDKWFKIRQDARSPINPICAKHAYDVIKPHVNTPEFGENLLRLIGFKDKDTKMLMAVTTAKKSEIIDAHPELDVTNLSLEHVGVSIKIVGPTGKTIVSFGSKEGERKAMSGKVSFANVEPVDLADLPLGQD